MPLWKYGARAARARNVGVLKRPRSFQSPVTLPRPASVNCRVSPVVLLRKVYSGRSGVRAAADAVRTSNNTLLMLVPLFAELWQALQLRPLAALVLLNTS